MKPEWEQRADRLDARLDRHIEFVAQSFIQVDQALARLAIAQEATEVVLQKLIDRVDRLEK